MTDNEHTEQADNPEQIPPQSPVNKTTNKDVSESDQGTHKEKNCAHSSQILQPFIIKAQKTKGWKRQEIISILGIAISAGLFIMTLKAFNKTSKSVAISDSALKHTIIRDSLNDIGNAKRDSVTNLKDSLTIALANESLNTQKQQFKMYNRPWLKVARIRFIQKPTAFAAPSVVFTIEDIGKYQSQIVSEFLDFEIMPTKPNVDSLKRVFGNDFRMRGYIENDTMDHSIVEWDKAVTKGQDDSLRRGITAVWFIADITYKDLLDSNYYQYKFIAIANPELTGYSPITNDNIEVTRKKGKNK